MSESETPRTDAEAGYYDDSGCWHHRTNGENVDADFARTLERELAAAKADAAELRVALSRIAGRCDAEASYKIARAALAKEKA
jgi:hypothetical protein